MDVWRARTVCAGGKVAAVTQHLPGLQWVFTVPIPEYHLRWFIQVGVEPASENGGYHEEHAVFILDPEIIGSRD